MKRLMILQVVVALFLVGCDSSPKDKPVEQQQIPANAVVIDVRTAEEFARGHVEGAVHIPVASIQRVIDQKVPDKSAPVYVYCDSGRRAGMAHEVLASKGYKAYNLGSYENAKKYLNR